VSNDLKLLNTCRLFRIGIAGMSNVRHKFQIWRYEFVCYQKSFYMVSVGGVYAKKFCKLHIIQSFSNEGKLYIIALSSALAMKVWQQCAITFCYRKLKT